MELSSVFSAVDALTPEYLDFYQHILTLESPSACKEGVDANVEAFVGKAAEYGFDSLVFHHDVSGNCAAITMNPQTASPSVCFSGHLDTVHPVSSFGSPAVYTDDEKIYGPGAADCKGGVAAALLAMAALHQAGYTDRPVKLLLQSDEEISSRSSGKATMRFICQQAQGTRAFFNVEPSDPGVVILGRKGILNFRFTVHGKSVHAGYCYNGASAVSEAAHKIVELEKMKDENGITCNCSLLTGGTSANTVPDLCTFSADVRFPDREHMEQAKKEIARIAGTQFVPGTSCEVQLLSTRLAMPRCERNLDLLERTNAALRTAGFDTLEPVIRFGGSDAADVTDAGIPCLDGMGIHGGGIHARTEFAYLDSLAQTAKRLAALAMLV